MMNQFFGHVGVVDMLDIVLMSILFYSALIWFKKTRAAFVLRGILIFGLIYLIARALDMSLMTWVFQGFFAIFLIALVVIFQEELRQAFERLAVWSFEKDRFTHFKRGKNKEVHASQEAQILATTLWALAEEKTGALVILRGKAPLNRHLNGGHELYGLISEALLQSIFQAGSMSHDGAVIVEGDRVTHFSCVLPLSKNFDKLRRAGTRHAAALGLSELTDAMCLVVSEEKGTVSIAEDGDIVNIENRENLTERIERFIKATRMATSETTWLGLLHKNTHEKIMAVIFAMGLWIVLVRGSNIFEKTYSIPVRYQDLSEDLMVSAIDPDKVSLVFTGTQKDFYLTNPADKIHIAIDLAGYREGVKTIGLTESDIVYPRYLKLTRIVTPKLRFNIRRTSIGSADKASFGNLTTTR